MRSFTLSLLWSNCSSVHPASTLVQEQQPGTGQPGGTRTERRSDGLRPGASRHDQGLRKLIVPVMQLPISSRVMTGGCPERPSTETWSVDGRFKRCVEAPARRTASNLSGNYP